jgi:hypothetical protein
VRYSWTGALKLWHLRLAMPDMPATVLVRADEVIE